MNVLFIGFGPHTRRIQFPYCVRKSQILGINNFVILDLERNYELIEREIQKYTDVSIHAYYTNKYIDEQLLGSILKDHNIDRVVLGTDPEHHAKYLEFLVKNDMAVLMDKPITAVESSAVDGAAARKIHDDFLELNQLYRENPKSHVTVLSQRRYHPGYLKIKDDLIENYNSFNVIPHYFHLLHSDGQLRMLEELDDISYHGFNKGYGKISHSGYHFIDTLYVYLKHFIEAGEIDNYVVHCHSLNPSDYSKHISHQTIDKLFNVKFDPYVASSTGEIDAYVTIQFKKGDRLVASARIDMLHSGFSDRLSVEVNKTDLYKGNGRIRHEKQTILQGPIYAAYIDSLQSKQIDLTKDGDDLTRVGGEHHFDLTRFSHSVIGRQIVSQHSIPDLMPIGEHGHSRGHQEEARFYCLDDFFSATSEGERSNISDLSDHHFTSLMMSKFYEALATKREVAGVL